jgi:uncharacterized protein (DUF1501 family)
MHRRRFLQSAALAAGGLALAQLPGRAVGQWLGGTAAFSDYRALVGIFLFGGNDSFNMVVPRSDAEYAVYAASRQNLAIAQDSLLPIHPIGGGSVQYGLHPAMSGLATLFEQGQAAVVANLGPLVRPVTRAEVLNGTAVVPPQLFSHNDQQDQWHTLRGRSPLFTGWAGRIADLLQPDTTGQRLPVNVSTTGTVALQIGSEALPYAMTAQGAPLYYGLSASGDALEQARRAAFERTLGAAQASIYARAFAGVQSRALATADIVNAALDQGPVLLTSFPDTGLGQQLDMVAQMIAVRDSLQMSRQIFLVGVGGFDTHDDQLVLQPRLLGDLSASLAAFHTALTELGVADRVVTFTQSDFGRTLTSNGDGTDHGWGGHQLVMGDAVLGQRIYGTMPELAIDGPDDTSGGRIIPTTAVDQYAATLARWFGIAGADLDIVAPNLANFAAPDLGFL